MFFGTESVMCEVHCALALGGQCLLMQCESRSGHLEQVSAAHVEGISPAYRVAREAAAVESIRWQKQLVVEFWGGAALKGCG